MVVQTRVDLHALCPQHLTKMIPVELVLKVGSDVFSKYCYGCKLSGCRYHFHIVQGYFETSEGQDIERDLAFWKRCCADGMPMYISEVVLQTGEPLWRCPQAGCNGVSTDETSATNPLQG
jgi:hypothetical protein